MNRRTFLGRSFAGSLGVLALRLGGAQGAAPRSGQAPAIVRAAGAVPLLPQGVAAGDAGRGRMVIWSRSDRPARMFVDYATNEQFMATRPLTVRGPAALESSDFTARVLLENLPAGQRLLYRVRFQDLADLRAWSDPVTGSFSTALWDDQRDVIIAWSADSVGQGWGINREFGGMRLYETMLKAQADLFIHCGDTIYADGPLQPEVKLPDGTVWRNVVTPAKSKVAETLDDYRGNFSTTCWTTTCAVSTRAPRRPCCGTTMRCVTTGTRHVI